MDELLNLLMQFMEQVEGSYDSLDDAEAQEISEFLIETMSFIMEGQQKTPEETIPQVQGPIPQGAELLWILSNGEPNAFVNYLRTYPGEGFKELVSNPNMLANVIAQLQHFNPHQEPGVGGDGIPNTDFPSSNVSGMQYDPESGKLLVKFHGKNKEPIYQYDGVPPQIFNLLKHGNAFAKTKGKNQWGEWWPLKSPSIGSSINQYLKKGGYQYQRIN